MPTQTRRKPKPEAAKAPKPARQTALELLIDEYLDYVKNEPDPDTGELRTERTQKYYTAILVRQLLPWCKEHGIREPSDLDQTAVNAFMAHLRKREKHKTWNAVEEVEGHISEATAHSYARAVNRMLHWAKQEPRIKLRKLTKQQRLVLEVEDIRKLEDAATTERDRLLIRLLSDTGIRASELCGLTVDDVLPPEGPRGRRKFFLRIEGAKDNRQRRVTVTQSVYERIVRFRDSKSRPARDELWLGMRRRPQRARRGGGDYAQLTPSGLGQILGSIADRAGIDKPTNPHAFRHSFITRRLREKLDPGLVAKMVGHTSLAMIYQNYDQQTEENAADALIKALEAEEKAARRR